MTASAGLLAAWTASGAVGLIGHPLRHALTWMALGSAVVASGRGLPGRSRWVLGVGLVLALAMTASASVTVNIGAVAVVLAAIALVQSGARRAAVLVVAEAVTVLMLFHTVRTSIPVAWLASDAVGTLLGRLAAALTRHSLWVGATLGGLDLLVAMGYLAVVAPLRLAPSTPRPGWPLRPIVIGSAVVLGTHLVYLAVLSLAARVVATLPPAEYPTLQETFFRPPTASVSDVLRHAVPWNLPLLALMIHAGVAAGILHWLMRYRQDATRSAASGLNAPMSGAPSSGPTAGRRLLAGAVLLAVLMPLSMAPAARSPSLAGKKIVLYERGFLNWLKPSHGEYGRYSIGMYGMLPMFLESLGARPLLSPELSESDLQDADAVVLLFPNEPWHDGQLERIWEFVRRGGALLVMGEHTVREDDGGCRFNEVLAPTAMRVRFDSAMFAVGGWLQSYEALWHPTSAGIEDNENEFGVVIGASVAIRPPARPLLAGRWGWSDPGDPNNGAAKMGNGRYDAGEKLGDLVLAAEQSFGHGKIVVFGDTSSLTNGINMGCHPYTSRLFAYLLDREARPLSAGRSALAVLLGAALIVLLTARADGRLVGGVALALSLTWVLCTAMSQRAYQVLPDGGPIRDNKLAYIDASHLEAYSRESWREDGVMGLGLTLMRHGYLTLSLPELTAHRLSRARMLVSIAPARPFTSTERAAVRQFVQDGGIFLCTVGSDRVAASQALLSEFGFQIDGATPLGYFKTVYYEEGDFQAHVRFHAAWPLICRESETDVITSYPPDRPLIAVRRIGRGRVVVIGDTCFAMNMNLEHIDGEPFEGLRENADFWRWFLGVVEAAPVWLPRRPDVPGGNGRPRVEDAAG